MEEEVISIVFMKPMFYAISILYFLFFPYLIFDSSEANGCRRIARVVELGIFYRYRLFLPAGAAASLLREIIKQSFYCRRVC